MLLTGQPYRPRGVTRVHLAGSAPANALAAESQTDTRTIDEPQSLDPSKSSPARSSAQRTPRAVEKHGENGPARSPAYDSAQVVLLWRRVSDATLLPEAGMRKMQVVLAAMALVVLGGYLVSAQQSAAPPSAAIPAGLPEWAYGPIPPPAPGATPAPRPPDDGTLKRIPHSSGGFTDTQITRGMGGVPDWHPEDHGPMPDIVNLGKPGARACGFCHLPDGRGNPENAGPWGLPPAYFIQQMEDFKSGMRKSSDPRKANANMMIAFAAAMTDEEVKAAADYFATTRIKPWIKVVETTTVPKTRTCCGGMFMPLEGAEAGEEPIGNRLVEVPEHPEETEMRDSHAGFIAYVPIGSLKKGEALVAKAQCALCHGRELDGIGPVPPIAGRSPSYIARQLFDMQTGARRGLWSALMKPIVAEMTNEDLINVSAYVASLPPTVAAP